MSYFVVIFLGLIAVVLLLVPLIWQLYQENSLLTACLKEAHKEVATTLRQSEYYRMACDNASDGIIIQNMRGQIIWCNPAYCALHARPSSEIMGRNPLEFALPPDMTPSLEEIYSEPFDISEGNQQRFLNQTSKGDLFWIELNASFHRTVDGRENAVVVCRDITKQIDFENHLRDIGLELEHEASHDGLTGVANRAAFLSFFEASLHATDQPMVGLLHIDLDEFKSINDTHGHSAGDAVLVHAAKAVQNHIRPCDMIARVGGDEFIVVCPGIGGLPDLDQLAKNILAAISEPFEWSNRLLLSEASIGAVVSSDHTNDPEDLLVQADFALYEAKRAGRKQVSLYDEDLHERHTNLMRRTVDLVDAVDTGALEYFFQPTMDLMTDKVIGFETLVRWRHAKDGIIPPDHFLPLAKDLGLMGAIDLLSMSAALNEKRKLNLAGHSDIGIAFNASPELLTHPEFVNRLVWGVEAGGIDREQITIEVLETTEFGEASEKTSHAAIVHDLRQAGFQVHLDDFGVGFAGLSHLATLDVSGVKVDRGLVTEILSDPTSRKIVRKIIELSNDLGLNVIAEGVEDLATAGALQDMGCKVIQGYWLSRPLPADDLYGWLDQRSQNPHAMRA